MPNTLDHADAFDGFDLARPNALAIIATFVREHDASAHVTLDGRVLVSNRDGDIRAVRSMRAACEWLGY